MEKCGTKIYQNLACLDLTCRASSMLSILAHESGSHLYFDFPTRHIRTRGTEQCQRCASKGIQRKTSWEPNMLKTKPQNEHHGAGTIDGKKEGTMRRRGIYHKYCLNFAAFATSGNQRLYNIHNLTNIHNSTNIHKLRPRNVYKT